MMPTRVATLVAIFLCAAALTWAALRAAENHGTVLPALPWGAPFAIAALGVAVLVAAFALRRRMRGAPGTKPPQPIGVARLAVLGKTSSHVGAMLGGGYAGLLLLLISSLEVAARRDRAVVAFLAVAGAILLVAAGLYLERACRLPPSDTGTAASDPD